MKRVGGVCYVRVGGAQYSLGGTLTVSLDPVEREGVTGLDGVHGYIEKPRVPFIEGEFTTTAELPIEAMQGQTDVTVTAELANGRVAVLRNAWTSAARDIQAADGKVTIKWEGIKGEWL